MLKSLRNKVGFFLLFALPASAGGLAFAGPITSITVLNGTNYTAGIATNTIFIQTFGSGFSTPDAGEVVTIQALSGGVVVANSISPSSFTTTGTGQTNGGNVGMTFTLFHAGSAIQLKATSAGGVTATGTSFTVLASSATKIVVLGPGMTHAPGTNPALTTGFTGSFTPQEPNQSFTVRVIMTDNQFNTITSASDQVSFTSGDFVTLPSPANLVNGIADFPVTMTAARVTRTLTVTDDTGPAAAPGTLDITTAGPPSKEVFPFPSPFNPHLGNITFRFRLSEPKDVKVIVTDLFGQNVWQRQLNAGLGFTDVTWDGRNDKGTVVAVGVYTVMLEVDGSIESKKRFGVTK